MGVRTRILLVLLAGSSSLIHAAQAAAQTAPPPDTSATPPASDKDIIITGSRVITNGNDSPTPVTVVPTSQVLTVQPTTISEALNVLPQFGGSQTSTSGPGAGIRNGGAAYITLRNAGDNHTLVLYDGHRILPAAPQESHASDVDLNLIPSILLKRVDIVTGGASAVYGSDAVSGVVNFITDTNFTGLKLEASSGISRYWDDPTQNIAIAFGKKLFGGRGHFEFSYEFRNDAGILDPTDKYKRPFFASVFGGGGLGTAASPYVLATDQRISNTSFGGKITATGALAALNNLNFTQNNTLLPFVNGATVAGSTSIQNGGDGAYYYNSTIKSSLRYHRLFGRFDYDLSDSTHAYLQYAFTSQESKNYFATVNASFNVGLNNPYLDTLVVNSPTLSQAGFAALRAANPNGSFRVSKFLLNQETGKPIISKMDFSMILGGINGTIGDFKWDLGFGHSWAIQNIDNPGNLDQGKFLAAIDTVRDGSGNIVCRAAAANPSSYGGCVPLNPFGPSSENAAALAYVTGDSRSRTLVKLDEIQGSITGSPFSTWAGPVKVALSAEYHRTSFRLTTNARPDETVDCNGLRFATLSGAAVAGNCNGPLTNNPTLRWAANTLLPLDPGVSVRTYEAAVEAQIPLLKDVRFARNVELNAAGRYTNYSTSGPAWTWKLGLIWEVTPDFRLRATKSHDIRAPNLNELFSPPTVAIVNFTDFVVNGVGTTQVGVVPRIQYSNPNLKPERADTITGGFILTPRGLSGFSFSVDAWRIRFKDAIFQVRGIDQSVINACVASNGTSPLCSLYIRPTPTSFPTLISGNILNIAKQETWGIDFETGLATRVWNRSLSLRLLAVYQPKNEFDTGPGGVIDTGGAYTGGPANVASSPKWRATFIGSIDVTDNLKFSVLERWRSSMRAEAVRTPGPTPLHVVDTVPAVGYTNLTLSYTIRDGGRSFEIYGNVQNLFNKFAEVPVGGPASALPSRGILPMAIGDDPIGRYMQVGVRVKF